MEAGFIKAFMSIAAVAALLGGVLFALKRFIRNKNKIEGTPELRVISKVALHQKSFICMVKAGMRTLLVGVSDGNVSLIADISDEFYEGDEIPREEIDINSIAVKQMIKKTPASSANPNKVAVANQSLSFSAFLKTAFKKN